MLNNLIHLFSTVTSEITNSDSFSSISENVTSNNTEGIINKTSKLGIGDGALFSLIAMCIVFLILIIIIALTHFIFKGTDKLEEKKKAQKVSKITEESIPNKPKEVIITDDDMMAAVLVTTIDYRNEIKKDVKVISVKEIQ